MKKLRGGMQPGKKACMRIAAVLIVPSAALREMM
jgi:hypothetical protein